MLKKYYIISESCGSPSASDELSIRTCFEVAYKYMHISFKNVQTWLQNCSGGGVGTVLLSTGEIVNRSPLQTGN